MHLYQPQKVNRRGFFAPSGPLPTAQLGSEIDQWLKQFFQAPAQDAGANTVVGLCPVNIYEDDQHVYVHAQLPGFSKEQIQIELDKNILSIVAKRSDQKPQASKATTPPKRHVHLEEHGLTQVARRFTMPPTLDRDKITAKLEQGILYLTLGKVVDPEPGKIEIT